MNINPSMNTGLSPVNYGMMPYSHGQMQYNPASMPSGFGLMPQSTGMAPYNPSMTPCVCDTQCVPMPATFQLARAYVPFQCLVCLYPPMQGLTAGTIFPELHAPYGVDPEYVIDA